MCNILSLSIYTDSQCIDTTQETCVAGALQCVAVCCSVSQCVAVCCIVLQSIATHWSLAHCYGVALVSRIDKSIGLFCKRALSKRRYSAKETYNFIDPTHCSHPIIQKWRVCNILILNILTIHKKHTGKMLILSTLLIHSKHTRNM